MVGFDYPCFCFTLLIRRVYRLCLYCVIHLKCRVYQFNSRWLLSVVPLVGPVRQRNVHRRDVLPEDAVQLVALQRDVPPQRGAAEAARPLLRLRERTMTHGENAMK